jgi:membrane-associated phospholipid phosphatase
MILPPADRRLRIGLAALLSSAVLCLIFWGLLQIDWPFARFLRSLHIVWLEQLGDAGTRLGSGAALVSVSVGLWLAGWMWTQPAVQLAGFKSLLAHGVAAIAAQALKHGIGRPRPRLMHAANGFPWRPSLESGLDSFPSGHTTASFAVATVLAKSFPRIAWLLYGIAGFIAVSRAVRGSHFPTDVMAGICLGALVGMSCVYPIREWKRVMSELMVQLLPYLILIFSLLWLMTHVQRQSAVDTMMVGGGIAMATGTGLRMSRRIRRTAHIIPLTGFVLGNVFIVIGLALTTSSWLVTALVVMQCVIHWVAYQEHGTMASAIGQERGRSNGCQAVLVEIPLVVALSLAVLIIQNLKGLLPLG